MKDEKTKAQGVLGNLPAATYIMNAIYRIRVQTSDSIAFVCFSYCGIWSRESAECLKWTIRRWTQPEQGVVFKSSRNTVGSVGQGQSLEGSKHSKRNKSKCFGADKNKHLGRKMTKAVI